MLLYSRAAGTRNQRMGWDHLGAPSIIVRTKLRVRLIGVLIELFVESTCWFTELVNKFS
jgi:hypothetical protein